MAVTNKCRSSFAQKLIIRFEILQVRLSYGYIHRFVSQRHCEEHGRSINERNRRCVVCYIRWFISQWPLRHKSVTQIGVCKRSFSAVSFGRHELGPSLTKHHTCNSFPPRLKIHDLNWGTFRHLSKVGRVGNCLQKTTCLSSKLGIGFRIKVRVKVK